MMWLVGLVVIAPISLIAGAVVTRRNVAKAERPQLVEW